MAKRKQSKTSRKKTMKKSKQSKSSKSSKEQQRLESLSQLIQENPDKLCVFDLVVGTNDAEYDKVRSNGQPVFARIHAKWCGHCNRMVDDWKQLEQWHKTNMKDKSSPLSSMVLVSVEDSDLGKVREKYPEFQANGFPTLLLLKNGQVMDTFQGERKFGGFKKYLEDRVGGGMHGGRKRSRKQSRKTKRTNRKSSRKSRKARRSSHKRSRK